MKNILSKTNFLALGLIVLLIPGLTSCKKDKLRKDLVGDWEVTSFTIDGVEAKGSVVTTSKMEFEKYTGDNGDFEWFISYADGSSETVTGDYTVDQEDEEVEMVASDGDRVKFELDLDDDRLELSGIIDGDRIVLRADRD